MPNANDIAWFKTQFEPTLAAALAGTPYTANFLCALACQETGEVWPVLRKKGLATDEIVRLCVGDTLDDTKGRSAFPRNRAELEAAKDGSRMFGIARQALLDMSAYIDGYKGAASNPNKFCHGFGVFQYDLQFFKTDPDYFLDRRYETFGASLGKCLQELDHAVEKRNLPRTGKLSEADLASVAIVYNTGRYDPRKGLKQGYRNAAGVYYGEALVAFMRLAGTVSVDVVTPPRPSTEPAIVTPPTPVAAAGKRYRVDTQSDPLVLRSAPVKSPPGKKTNRIGLLPDGTIVRAVGDARQNGYLQVQTSLNGALLTGWAYADLLKPVVETTPIPVVEAAEPSVTPLLPAVYMPRKAGTVTKRTDPAGAYSLNEPGQPGRTGDTPDALKTSIARIIAWLAPDLPAHKRYQPTASSTFCNIYAHDFCYLNGVYLPRVWWSQAAIVRLLKGETVTPVYGTSIDEIRANGLFRWLRDFGPDFGWRQTGTVTKLQAEVNQGAIGLIVARRTEEGKSGHIVAVVPETETHRATRNAAGEVTNPLQSQAGTVNFSYGTGRKDWWLGAQFAEHAFWIHG
ncbi:hypothetical protein AEAC466_09845 [Asticcacaulis sp. AC466]|uniref:hypothetical protein n=1 Tax=Asticcacaulis sp. AC466 TaxID=1282362 RepID=UPI0003C3FC25|nr:hypothetical protein [Asticcacaulis sp. AC466]ESQ84037.1 hypothetical protein AEAC466_09845 [Asticcacaulis sp. AC466]